MSRLLQQHPNRINPLINLAEALKLRYKVTEATEDLERSIGALEQAVDIDTAKLSSRIQAAWAAISLLDEFNPHRARPLLFRAVERLH